MPNTREKLIELLYNFYLDYNGYICDGCGTRFAERECAAIVDHLIDNDVVPVVRCKDCKWYKEDTGISPDFIGHYCALHKNDYSFFETDFCSCGERREGE